ncbi:hypothetical protein HK103_003146 [Boothiomyces macroporosus]|uniref:FAD dependent oxidoreductase domain-containing protein n=1 Tax=Boothiomyces macroporosus TaxID=261099 RepID=A0AAD5Y9B1_9FUNG|nr:hypothetical protein HK103_003146 [Boothiomyces macroporosus]
MPEIVVLGAGVIGLTTALYLQSKGHSVTIISKSFPDKLADDYYTSPKAGAHWRSVASDTDYRLQTWDKQTLEVLLKLHALKEAPLILIPSIELFDNTPKLPYFSSFVPKFKLLEKHELKGKTFGYEYETICIDVPAYLDWLQKKFKSLGGRLLSKSVTHVNELFDYADIAVNCTGLGSRYLGGVQDELVYPTRGQTVLVRAPQVKYTITTGDDGSGFPSKSGDKEKQEKFTYVIPRKSGIVVLGGTYQEGDGDLRVNQKTSQDIIRRCLTICPELAVDGKVDVVEDKVGLRPTRKGGVRLEKQELVVNGRKVSLIHNYGHGGYGFQSSWGTAKSVSDLLPDLPKEIHQLFSKL